MPVRFAQTSPTPSSSPGPITHIVIMIQENRSYDDLFATYPNADGTTSGQEKTQSGDQTVSLTEVNLKQRCDFGHAWGGFKRDLDGGKMDGFNLEGGGNCHGQAGLGPYQYVNPAQVAPYWDIAGQFVLADHMFQTQGSGSFTAHQDLIRGGTMFGDHGVRSLVDYPSALPWGCDAAPGTATSILLLKASELHYRHFGGPFPCMNYMTMRDLLDAKGVSWKYYTPAFLEGGGEWNAFDAIRAVRYGPEWGVNVVSPEKDVLTDISNGALPALSWVIPDKTNSDHPDSGSDHGPSWVATVVNAIGESSTYWPNTAIIILWDDWGGFYDHVPPPLQDQWGGLGFRVPALVVSAYTPPANASNGYISHTPYEFGSILKFVEQTFGLGSLGTTDQRATSISDCFDFNQQPRAFTVIPTLYSRAYFERQRPSNQPVDTE